VDNKNRLVLCGLGDVFINHPVPESGFAALAPLLSEADIVFGNCEGVYSERVDGLVAARPNQADGLKVGSINIMSGANNHFASSGGEVLQETKDILQQRGIEVVGAGANLQEARAPVFLKRRGLKVAFLGFVSNFYAGQEAKPNRAGINPLRFHNHYYRLEGDRDYNPCGIPEVMAIPYESDMLAMKKSIADAKSESDIVVVSYHWGDAMRPFIVFPYERETASIAIDCGADAILCHHPHIVKGVNFYRDVPIFHGLGNSVFHVRNGGKEIAPEVQRVLEKQAGEYAPRHYADYPLLPMHPESRISMVAVCSFDREGVNSTGIVQAYIQPSGQVVPLELACEQGQELAKYYQKASDEEGLNSTICFDDTSRLGGYDVLTVKPRSGSSS